MLIHLVGEALWGQVDQLLERVCDLESMVSFLLWDPTGVELWNLPLPRWTAATC